MIYLVTLGYAPVAQLLETIGRASLTLGHNKHVLVDLRYPLNKNGYHAQLAMGCYWADVDYLRPAANRGIHGNYNWISRELQIDDGDVVAFYDPDNNPATNTWLMDACRVMQVDNSVIACILKLPVPDIELQPIEVIGGVPCRPISRGHSWPMGVYRGSWLKSYQFRQLHPHYGYIEDAVYHDATAAGKRLVFLDNHVDRGGIACDERYAMWKRDSANKLYDKSFEQYVADNGH
jgi:hypothetical protein